MAVKTFNPTSPAVRQMAVADYSVLTKKEPEKSLLVTKKNKQKLTLHYLLSSL